MGAIDNLVGRLREEADFNLSWTDGRRNERDISAAYRERRLEVAAQRFDEASRVDRMQRALTAIACGTVPPDQHGHYLAHREAVRIAREALANREA